MSDDRFMILDQRGIDIYNGLTKEETVQKLKELAEWRKIRVKPDQNWRAAGLSRKKFLERFG